MRHEGKRRDRCSRSDLSDAGCSRDVGWPYGAALQGEAPNHRELRRSKAEVVSVAEKGAQTVRQVRAKKANASEPLMKCRNVSDGAETEVCLCPREELGGDLLTAQVVSGM